MLVFIAGIHKLLVRIGISADINQTASEEVCAVCLDIIGRQLAFKILGHLAYYFYSKNLRN